MKIYIPNSQDHLEIHSHSISICDLKSIMIDYEKHLVTYESWLDTKYIRNIPGPRGFSDVIYTGKHEIDETAMLVMVSLMHKIKNHRVECLLHDSVYCSRKHKYLLRFSVKYIKNQLNDEIEICKYDAIRPVNLDFD